MNPCVLFYLHGFESSPASYKAQVLADFLRTATVPVELRVPALPVSPAQAMQLLEDQIQPLLAEGVSIGLVGSSLGGFYALAALRRWPVLRVVNINPAVYPYRLLGAMLGPRVHPYSGDVYVLGEDHMQELLALDVPVLQVPERLLQLLQTGDTTLDYREALQRYPVSPTWIMPGGSHEFDDFRSALPAVLSFLGLAPSVV